jgi:carbon starvation protein CstA
MDAQAIVAMMTMVASGIIGIVYFMMNSIKSTLKQTTDEMISKIDKFVEDLAEVKETVAVKSTMLDYMQREIEVIKKQCWKCAERNSRD